MSIEEQCAEMLAADPYAQALLDMKDGTYVAQVTVRALATTVAEMYECGVPHEMVTAVLEKVTAGEFRKHLVEIHDDHGPWRWMLAPSKVSIVVSQ